MTPLHANENAQLTERVEATSQVREPGSATLPRWGSRVRIPSSAPGQRGYSLPPHPRWTWSAARGLSAVWVRCARAAVLRRHRQLGRVGGQRTVGTRSAVPATRTACSSARRGSERRTPMEGDRAGVTGGVIALLPGPRPWPGPPNRAKRNAALSIRSCGFESRGPTA
jgi:hypothetical protein